MFAFFEFLKAPSAAAQSVVALCLFTTFYPPPRLWLELLLSSHSVYPSH